MQRSFYFSLIFSFLFLSSGFAQDAADVAPAPGNFTSNLTLKTVPNAPSAVVLFDNGPIITLPAGGCSGGDASILDNTNGSHSTYGWGFQANLFNWVADDFVSTEQWTIDSLKLYTYQTGATAVTITGLYVQIWNGAPNAGGTVVWGDTVTNRLSRATMSNMYRALISTPTDCNRRIQELVANVGTTLPAGHYWVQFGATGSLSSGPWCPPVTIAGQLVTGDAMQEISGTWAAALNGTSAAGAPFILYGTAGSAVYTFFENFDSYTAGQRLACQAPTVWTTWSNLPCDATEDPMVSNAQSTTAPNSVVITQNNDLVKTFGDLSIGKWYCGFKMYIPAGKSGYWNMLSSFGATNYWAFECYFDAGGAGRLMTETSVTTNFTWTPGTWQWVEMVIDLDQNLAKFYMGGSITGTLVHQWPWTSGSSSGTGTLVIDAVDIFGAASTDQMYVDNFFLGPLSLTPVELTSFGASVNDGHVVLNWTTATEQNNQGFEVERKAENGDFMVVGFVRGHGTSTQVQNYSYTDASIAAGKYSYRLKQVDFNGEFKYSDVVEVEIAAPLAYQLDQNYPNPFNPSTQINFSIAEPTMVRLAVFNLLGQEVKVLKNEVMQPGLHQVEFNASDLPSGMYIYKLETANYTSTRKMMLMK